MVASSSRCRETENRTDPPAEHEDEEDSQRPFGQNLRHALVYGSKASRLSLARWKTHHLGCLHIKQGPCNSSAVIVGHDLRLLAERKLCRLRWSGQHLLHLQPLCSRWAHSCRARVVRPLWVPFLLQIYQRSSHFDIVWGHDLRPMGR